MTGKLLRLYPLPSQEVSAIYEDLELPPRERRDDTRPYVIVNMVSSLDGKVAIEGKASRLGSQTDHQAMRTLRSKAGAVMIGAGTLRAEKLSLGLDDPAGRQPLAVIATNSGDIPLESNLIVGGGQEVLVITTEDAPDAFADGLPGRRTAVLRVPSSPSGSKDLGEALRILKAEHAVDLLVVEGGPSLNHSLISQNLADELFLTLAPKLLGGTTEEVLTVLKGGALEAEDINLLSAYLAGDELFLRYGLRSLEPEN